LKLLSALSLILLIYFVPGQAQVKEQSDKVPSPSDYSKEAYVFEKAYQRVRVEDDGSGTREQEVEAKVLGDAGVKALAVLTFVYTSANQVVDVDYVRVQKPDGTIVKTPDYNIQDMPGEVTRIAPMYSDIHEKHIAVKGLAVGDTLQYLVRYRVVKPEIPGHFWFESTFIKNVVVKEERLEVNAPAGKYLKVSSPGYKPEIREEVGRRVYVWRNSNLHREEQEPKPPPRRKQLPPSVQMTTFRSWEEVGNWYSGLQKNSLELTPALRDKAAELTKDLQTDDEKVRAIYKFVALNFHYIGLDFGIGRYQPHSADDVLGNGYGDCKDKHTLLAALLKAAGYDAWPASIHTSRTLDPDVPSPAQFNHVITVVPSNGRLVWLDTTPEVAPYQVLIVALRDQQALVMAPNKAPELMRTPAVPPSPQEQTFKVTGTLGPDGTFTGHVEQSYQGEAEIIFRSAYRQVSQADWKQLAQRLSYTFGFGGEINNVEVSAPDAIEKPFQVSYDYVRKEYGDWENRQIPQPMPPMGIESRKDAKKPPEPPLLGAPGRVEYEARMVLPPGYSATPNADVDLVRPYAEYHSSMKIKDSVLTASRRLLVKQPQVGLDQWEDFRDFGKAVSDDEFKFLHLEGGSSDASGGKSSNPGNLEEKFRAGYEAMQKRDSAKAEELFRQVIAGNPKYKEAHLDLGLVLATEGKFPEALEECHKEQEVNPDETRAYLAPATFLTMLGRQDEAIGEWQKLLKVDPKNREAALQLAGLLSLENKDAEAARVLEKAVEESPGSPKLEMALGEAYVKSGEVEKGIPHMQKALGDPGELDPGMLNDAAYLLAEKKTNLDLAKDYAEKSISELETRSQQDALSDSVGFRMFAAVWDTLGWIDFQSGDAQGAEGFVRSAWMLDQEAVEGDHLGQIYEKLGKKTEAARIYEKALAAHSMPVISFGNPRTDVATTYQQTRDQILSHYARVTGRKTPPPAEIRRLPNGEWTKTPGEELASAREVKISSKKGLAATADFMVAITAEKVEAVRFVKGDEELKSLVSALQSVHYPMEFPAGSKAKIVRQVHVTCHPTAGCSGEMMLPPERMP
jgi:tetratricopeptide (TPR) repeat protein/transglutaminase-like putative cysteine protease